MIYAKIEDRLDDIFEQKEIYHLARHVYTVLGRCLAPDSSVAIATYQEIRRRSGLRSDETISNSLKELIKADLIEKVGYSQYKLKVCIYKGIRENEGSTANVVKPKISSTANVEPHAHASELTLLRQEEQQHVAVSLKFCENSAFKQTSTYLQKKLCDTYGLDVVQTKLTALEKYYRDREQPYNPPGLLFSALKDDYSLKTKEERDEIELERKRDERREAVRLHDEAREKEKYETDFYYARNDRDLVKRVDLRIQAERPDCAIDGLEYKILRDQWLLEEFRMNRSVKHG